MSFPGEWTCKAAGVTHGDDYPSTLNKIFRMNEPVPCALRRDPDNPYDVNAIEIYVPLFDARIGYVPAGVAAHLAPLLDEGERWMAEIDRIDVHPDHPDRPGATIRMSKIEDSDPF